MPAKRSYRVRVRLKVRNRFFRRSGLVVAVALGAGFAVYAGLLSYSALRRSFSAPVFSFRLKELALDCPAPVLAVEIRSLFSDRIGRALSSSDCADLALEIKKRHASVREVSVRRNFLSGGAAVAVKLEPVAAQVSLEDGTTAYLSAGGKLMTESFFPPAPNGFTTGIYGPREDFSAPALAGFIRDLGVLADSFSSPPARLEYRTREKTCRIYLRNGCEVLWGGFEFTRLKVIRLNEVLNDVSLKLRLPVRVDLRSFREGRIFVSAGG